MPANHFVSSLVNLDWILSFVMTAQIYPFGPVTIRSKDRPLWICWAAQFDISYMTVHFQSFGVQPWTVPLNPFWRLWNGGSASIGKLRWLFFNEIACVWFFEELADMMPCHHQKSSIRNQMIRITLFDHYRTEKSYDIKTWLIKKAQTCTHKACSQFACTTESKHNWKRLRKWKWLHNGIKAHAQ